MLHSHASLLAMVAGIYGIVSALSPALQIVRMRRTGSSASRSRGYVAIGAAMQTCVLVWAVRIGRDAGALTT